MGRRSFGISFSQINRAISAANAAAKARERRALIVSQYGIATEMEPTYKLYDVDFNERNRVTHIEIIETKQYRTIERYVTQNRVRHPIYSDWKTKSKTLKKTIKLTNEVLENLKNNDDKLISLFSYEIVSRLGKEDLYPSWFLVDTLKNEKDYEIESINLRSENSIKEKEISIRLLTSAISTAEEKVTSLTQQYEKLEKRIHNKNVSLEKAKNKKHFVLFAIISFGI